MLLFTLKAPCPSRRRSPAGRCSPLTIPNATSFTAGYTCSDSRTVSRIARVTTDGRTLPAQSWRRFDQAEVLGELASWWTEPVTPALSDGA